MSIFPQFKTPAKARDVLDTGVNGMVVRVSQKLTVDTHVDSLWVRYKRGVLGRENVPAMTPKAMQLGGLNSAFFALYLPDETMDRMAQMEIDLAVEWQIQEFEREYKSQMEHHQFLGLENARLLGASVRRLEYLAGRGVRYMGLVHKLSNDLCDSCTDKSRWRGLSDLGKMLVKAADELDIICDVSHSSDAAAEQIMGETFNPVIASHSGCRALWDHARNLPDDLIRDIVGQNGLVCVPFAKNFVGPRFTVVDHIDHIVQVTSRTSGVGIGSDLDGAMMHDSCPDVSKWGYTVMEALSRKGYKDDEINRIKGGNVLRMFTENYKA